MDKIQLETSVALLMIGYIFILLIIKLISNNLKEKTRRKLEVILIKTIDDRLRKGLIKDRDDIMILISALSRKFNRHFSLINVLEDYLTFKNIRIENDINEEIINLELIKKLILEENERKPYENAPEKERSLLININNGLKKNDLDFIKNNLNELYGVIYTKSLTYEKINKINKWSTPIAIGGVLFTILFGIMGFFK